MVSFGLVGDAKEHVDPFLIEFAAGMIVASLVQARHLTPPIMLATVHFTRGFSRICTLSRTSYHNKCVHEATNGVTVARVLHFGPWDQIPRLRLRIEHKLARFFHLLRGYVKIAPTDQIHIWRGPQLHILKIVG